MKERLKAYAVLGVFLAFSFFLYGMNPKFAVCAILCSISIYASLDTLIACLENRRRKQFIRFAHSFGLQYVEQGPPKAASPKHFYAIREAKGFVNSKEIVIREGLIRNPNFRYDWSLVADPFEPTTAKDFFSTRRSTEVAIEQKTTVFEQFPTRVSEEPLPNEPEITPSDSGLKASFDLLKAYDFSSPRSGICWYGNLKVISDFISSGGK